MFVSPDIDWGALAPVLIIAIAAVVGVLSEAFAPRAARRHIQVPLAIIALAASLVTIVWRWTVVSEDGPLAIAGGQLIEDKFTLAFQAVIVISSLVAMLVIADRTQTREGAFVASGAARPGSPEERESSRAGIEQTEIYPLTLFAVLGMTLFPASGDLLTLFIALEVLSLPLYVLSGLARRKRLISQEAALKYFLLGAFSSAFLLMGIALLYGFSGSLVFSEVMTATAQTVSMDWMLVAGVILVFVGLLFKVGAVPFHSWTPDVYQGAPTPITGFMAAGTKIAAFGAMIRFLYVVAGGLEWNMNVVFWVVAIISMAVGTYLGLVQNDIKRMLAYSAIAHTGFILIGVMSFSTEGISAVLFYLLAYALATVGAFGVVSLVRERDASGAIVGEARDLESWAGLAKRSPFLAIAMLVFLLSFAGIPLTSGFVGKFVVFAAGVAAGNWVLVLIAILASAATAFFYFRIIVLMFFTEPDGDRTAAVGSEGLSVVGIAICAVGTILLGIVPGPVLELLSNAAVLLP